MRKNTLNLRSHVMFVVKCVTTQEEWSSKRTVTKTHTLYNLASIPEKLPLTYLNYTILKHSHVY